METIMENGTLKIIGASGRLLELSESAMNAMSEREQELLLFYIERDYACLDSDEKILLVCRLINSDYDSTEAENYVLANAKGFFNRIMESGNNAALRLLLESGRIIGELDDELYDRLAAYSECDGTLRVLFDRVMRIPESPEPFTIWDNVLVRCNDRSIEEADIPDEVTIILNSAFENCKKLKKVWLPDGLQGIHSRAFCGCSALETVLPGSLWLIDNQKQLILPESVKNIAYKAFWGCQSLCAVELPDGVQGIGDSAFVGCSRVREFTLSDTTELGNHVFDNAASLEHVTVRRASGTYVIDIPEDARCRLYDRYDLFRMIVKRDFSEIHPLYFSALKSLVCSMLVCNDDNGETVDYVLSGDRQKNFSLLLNRLEPELMEQLLSCRKLTIPPLSRLYSELLDYTIDTQSHDLQVRLMNAANSENNDPQDRLKL